MTSRSAQLKEEVAAIETSLANIAKSQASADKFRQDENADFTANKAEMEQGISGVQMAIKIIREYYAGEGQAHTAAAGAGSGIVGILEVCLSDFTKGLAEMMAMEEAAAAQYARTMQENKLESTTKSQ